MEKFKDQKFTKLCTIYLSDYVSPSTLGVAGVFALKCEPTKHFFLVASDDILGGIEDLFIDLENGNIRNEKLLKDFTEYGKENFSVYALYISLDLENPLKREKALEDFRSLFSADELY